MKIIKRLFLSGFFFAFFSFDVGALDIESFRSFANLFPNLGRTQIRRVYSETGLRNNFLAGETSIITPAADSGIDIYSKVMEKKPNLLVEALMVVPYNAEALTKLDAFNAVGRIESLSHQTVYSEKYKRNIPIFEQSTRVNQSRRNAPIPDPPPATSLPYFDTIYLYLKDVALGNTYLRGVFSSSNYGILYSFTNYQTIYFLFYPVLKAEKYPMILYLEPLQEGMLVYGMAGIELPENIVTKYRVPLSSNIGARVTVFFNWLREGLKR